MLLLHSLLACGSAEEACRAACLDFESIALELQRATGDDYPPMSSAEYKAMCDAAPRTDDCGDCYAWIQEQAYTPYAVGWDCGCGLDAAGVAECRQEPDVPEDEAAASVADCIETCEPYGLVAP